MQNPQTPRRNRKGSRAALETISAHQDVRVFLNGGALFALRYVLRTRGPVTTAHLADWVQHLVDLELVKHGLPVEVRK